MGEIVSRLKSVRFEASTSGAAVAEGAHIAGGCFLAPSAVLYPGVSVGPGCVILDGAVLGRLPISNGTTTRAVPTTFSALRVGERSIIGCHAVVYTGVDLGARVLIGDLASVREGCRIGGGCVIGRGVMILSNCSVGAYTRVQDQAHLVGDMVIEEHVFIGMGVITSNDNDVYVSRFGVPGNPQSGPVVRRLAVIGAAATILPNLEIGEGALVGAGAVVTREVAPWTIVTGVPARARGPVPDRWRDEVLRRAAERQAPPEPEP
jgi:acetyltransferase-like isoleucine patch superfamily enzyme